MNIVSKYTEINIDERKIILQTLGNDSSIKNKLKLRSKSLACTIARPLLTFEFYLWVTNSSLQEFPQNKPTG